MNCGRVSNQLSAYIDRELTGAEMLTIRRHLGDCDDCQAEYEALCRMKMLLGRLQSPSPGPDFVPATLRRWEGHAPAYAGIAAGSQWWTFLVGSLVDAWDRTVAIWLCQPAWAAGRFSLGAWRRPVVLATAALAAALVMTGVMLHQPRHADALIATSPLAVLEGQDPLNGPSNSEWVSLSQPGLSSPLSQPAGSQPALGWVNVSLHGDTFGSYR